MSIVCLLCRGQRGKEQDGGQLREVVEGRGRCCMRLTQEVLFVVRLS